MAAPVAAILCGCIGPAPSCPAETVAQGLQIKVIPVK